MFYIFLPYFVNHDMFIIFPSASSLENAPKEAEETKDRQSATERQTGLPSQRELLLQLNTASQNYVSLIF